MVGKYPDMEYAHVAHCGNPQTTKGYTMDFDMTGIHKPEPQSLMTATALSRISSVAFRGGKVQTQNLHKRNHYFKKVGKISRMSK